jgi:hypothetical protein
VIQIKTTVPIPMETIKRKFTEEIEFIIDCANSKFKKKMLLTYLTNLELTCRLELTDKEETLELVVAYLNSPTCIDMPDLEDIVMNMLLALQGKPSQCALSSEELFKFADNNKEIFETWFRRLNAIPLYAEYCLADREDSLNTDPENEGEVLTKLSRHRADRVKEFPLDTNEQLAGINYANLIRHPDFILYLEGVTPAQYTYNEKLFNERRIFSGKNLFWYFANVNNPIFVMMVASMSEETMADFNAFMTAIGEDTNSYIKELGNVSLT